MSARKDKTKLEAQAHVIAYVRNDSTGGHSITEIQDAHVRVTFWGDQKLEQLPGQLDGVDCTLVITCPPDAVAGRRVAGVIAAEVSK